MSEVGTLWSATWIPVFFLEFYWVILSETDFYHGYCFISFFLYIHSIRCIYVIHMYSWPWNLHFVGILFWLYSSFHSTNAYTNLQVIARLCLLLCYGNRFWSIHFFALQACQSFTQRDLKTGGTFVGLQLCLWLACTDNTWVVRRNPCYLLHIIELILLTYIGIKHHDKDPHEPTSKMGCHQGFVTVVQGIFVDFRIVWVLEPHKPTTHSSSSRSFWGPVLIPSVQGTNISYHGKAEKSWTQKRRPGGDMLIPGRVNQFVQMGVSKK